MTLPYKFGESFVAVLYQISFKDLFLLYNFSKSFVEPFCRCTIPDEYSGIISLYNFTIYVLVSQFVVVLFYHIILVETVCSINSQYKF